MTQKGATADFFFIFAKKTIFSYKKKCEKKKKLRPPDWPELWLPAGQETDFLLGTAWATVNVLLTIVEPWVKELVQKHLPFLYTLFVCGSNLMSLPLFRLKHQVYF